MTVDTTKVNDRREIRYGDLDDLLADIESHSGEDVILVGNWSQGQIFDHLASTILWRRARQHRDTFSVGTEYFPFLELLRSFQLLGLCSRLCILTVPLLTRMPQFKETLLDSKSIPIH